ncbi:DUF3300 domain-containing protein [Mangrovibacterium lignilyticum]|uniref:DUF3300 domain-containing protein n=1 Tax=Mangrovibacterium lignilyticum TaxID=2668052 RepID=UPI0013D2878D|nr:DUF3300 domain-containing protein [Mangrovibacterium lignilyticum]
MKYSIWALFMVLCSFLYGESIDKQVHWPREIKEQKYLITLYQPQLETLNDNILEGRMALSVKDKNDELIFGALWFKVFLSTDMETRLAVMEKMEIPIVKFPDVEDEAKLQALKEIIIENLESANMEISIDQVLASVETVAANNELSDQLNNQSPTIYFRREPTVLVSIDGEPILKKVENSKMEYVVNTPFFIVKTGNKYFLKGGEYWYTSQKLITEDWTETKSVPNEVIELSKGKVDEEKPEDVAEDGGAIPKIISVSEPSELVVTSGDSEYEPIKETSLLYVKNSESDILMDINSQEHFLLLNGRWYSSKTLKDGDWNFVEPENLPEEFAQIPADTTGIASVRVSVPGTPEATDAMFEQYIPQTATVDRKTATVEVTYDGEPKFEKIEGTALSSAVNTESTVLKLEDTYYCVDEGVWFEASSPKGTWKVADSRPEEVDQIPPSSPVYNVKYVYIYDSTPDVVYVGYTPGYYNSYVYGGVVVYGTGFYYRPWYGSYYYPRPVTYGFGVHYNPYTGWGFSVGISFGWLSIGYHPSFWGPSGYRYGYRHGYYHGYHHGYNRGYASGYYHGRHQSNNIYRNRRTGVTHTRNNTRPVNNSRIRPSTRPNNVYTDRSGNVFQRDNKGNWEQKNKRPVSQTRPTNLNQRPTQSIKRPTQSVQRPDNKAVQRPTRPAQRPAQGNYMNSQFQNRSRGNTNTRNFQNSRAAPAGNRGRAKVPQRTGVRR